jgi:hypothetical protein
MSAESSREKRRKYSYVPSATYIDKSPQIQSVDGLDWSVPNRGTRNARRYKFSASMLYAYNHDGYNSKDVARTGLLQKNFPKVFKRCLTLRGNELLSDATKGVSPTVLNEHYTQEEIIDKILDDMPMLTGLVQEPTNRAKYHQKIGNPDELILQVSTNTERKPLIRAFIDETSPLQRQLFTKKDGFFSKAIDEDLLEKVALSGLNTLQDLLNSYSPFIHTETEWKTALKKGVTSRCMTQSGTLHEAEETVEGATDFADDYGCMYEPDLKGPHENLKWFHELKGEDWIIYGLFDGRLVPGKYMKDAKQVASVSGDNPFIWGGGWMMTGEDGKPKPRVAMIYEAKERQFKMSGIKASEMVQIAIYHEMIRLEFSCSLPVMLVETTATKNVKGKRESVKHVYTFDDDNNEAKKLIMKEVSLIMAWLVGLRKGGCEQIKDMLDSVLW